MNSTEERKVEENAEQWIDLPGYSNYKVNKETGQVFNRKTGNVIVHKRTNPAKGGEPRYYLVNDAGVRDKLFTHNEIMEMAGLQVKKNGQPKKEKPEKPDAIQQDLFSNFELSQDAINLLADHTKSKHLIVYLLHRDHNVPQDLISELTGMRKNNVYRAIKMYEEGKKTIPGQEKM